MTSSYKRWQKLFLFCLGLSIGATFCMKWMEADLWQNGQKFTIIGLEIGYSKERLISILSGLSPSVRTILRYNLSFDFAFMAAVYPGIAALCMMARDRSVNAILKRLLFFMALLQTAAWGCDIFENCSLLNWIRDPAIGNGFGFYHSVVAGKWIIALSGALLGIPLSLRRRRKS